jgi:hypothetical protein
MSKIVGTLVIGIVLALLNVLVYGFGLFKLWNWFMPIIFEASPLRFVEALAINLIIGFILMPVQQTVQNRTNEPTEGSALERAFVSVLGQAIAVFIILFVGWIIRSLM